MSALEFPQGKCFQSFVLSDPERSSSSTRRGREERSKNILNTCVNNVPARLCLGKRYPTFNLSEHIHAVNKACACLRCRHNTCKYLHRQYQHKCSISHLGIMNIEPRNLGNAYNINASRGGDRWPKNNMLSILPVPDWPIFSTARLVQNPIAGT